MLEGKEGTEETSFKSLTAKLNCVSLDKSDVQYAANEMCTKMANPTSWKRLKKARQDLSGVVKLTWVTLAWKHDGMTVDVHVDSDSAKRLGGSRRSES